MKKTIVSILFILCLIFALAIASADEIVLADNDNVCIKVKSMETSGNSFEMKLYLENKSSVTAMFTIDGTVVNGFVADPFWASEIAPGKKSNETVSIHDLSSKGITEDVSIISFVIRAYDSNDWFADDLHKERFTLYPLGEENASIAERKPQESDTVIVDNDTVAIIVTGYGTDSIWGYTANLFLENKTDKDVMFTVDNTSVNGFMIDPFWATEIPPHAKAFSGMSWRDSSLAENDIESVEEIETTFRAYDSNDWFADDYYKDTVTLKP